MASSRSTQEREVFARREQDTVEDIDHILSSRRQGGVGLLVT